MLSPILSNTGETEAVTAGVAVNTAGSITGGDECTDGLELVQQFLGIVFDGLVFQN